MFIEFTAQRAGLGLLRIEAVLTTNEGHQIDAFTTHVRLVRVAHPYMSVSAETIRLCERSILNEHEAVCQFCTWATQWKTATLMLRNSILAESFMAKYQKSMVDFTGYFKDPVDCTYLLMGLRVFPPSDLTISEYAIFAIHAIDQAGLADQFSDEMFRV